jgi:hypothetical protein
MCLSLTVHCQVCNSATMPYYGTGTPPNRHSQNISLFQPCWMPMMPEEVGLMRTRKFDSTVIPPNIGDNAFIEGNRPPPFN